MMIDFSKEELKEMLACLEFAESEYAGGYVYDCIDKIKGALENDH